uniref:Moesin/ezrin/radixin homolog 1 n=1 Tax=Bursaphelenchus xylophilus TaxID=6326 RepID=A0A1I7SA36_BURXY
MKSPKPFSANPLSKKSRFPSFTQDVIVNFALVAHRANGQALFDEVCRHLNLLESDYFGLEFLDGYGNRCWLDKDKSILRQITVAQSDARFYFVVKFYTPNPAELEEEYTRYLLSLQLRRDLAHGEFVCNENTAALLASFIVQAECGDYSAEDYPDHTYLSVTSFVPHQTTAFQMKVMENHKKLVGMTPADADLALLETARRCDFYGIKLHQAKDLEGTDIALSVAHMGIKVFQHLNCASTFSWAKIRKLSFKRKKLMVKLHPDPYQFQKETAEFIFDNRNECKNFWKKCVEHHAFFRCIDVQPDPKKESKFFSRGSSFRYHGRTQKQLIDYVREHHKRREPFERLIRPSVTPRGQSIHHVLDATRDSSIPYQPVTASQDIENIRQRRLSAQKLAEEKTVKVAQRPKSAHSRPTSEYVREDRACSSEYEPKSERLEHNGNKVVYNQNPSTSAEPDPMSVSLPNVLGEDIKVICREFQVRVDKAYPSKSASGENFLNQSRDNISEGSYRLEENSSQSDVATTYSNATDPRVYSTTFTTKRVGNVIVKKVKPSTKPVRPTNKDSSDDDSSNYSDCRISSVSAPARQSNRILTMNASQVRAGFARCKDNIPVPIDCPPPKEPTPPVASVGTCINMYVTTSSTAAGTAPVTSTTSTSTIIRPVVLSSNSPPTPIRKPIFIKPKEGGTAGAVVGRPSTFDPEAASSGPVVIKSENSSFRPFISNIDAERRSPIYAGHVSTSAAYHTTYNTTSASIPAGSTATTISGHINNPSLPFNPSGPLPGKIITRQNVVLTPQGVDVKPEKPAVPPKPKDLLDKGKPAPEKISEKIYAIFDRPGQCSVSTVKQDESQSSRLAETAGPSSGTFSVTERTSTSYSDKDTLILIKTEKNSSKSDAAKLLEPLESILNDANQLAFLSEGKERKEVPFPTLISVESEDRPDLKKLHLLNGEIPYTLTMRNVQQTPAGANYNNYGEDSKEGSPDIKGKPTRRSTDSLRARKSIDLVHRNRLPSLDSFSSQDHSISPTTPEAGNVIDYVSRRRSTSSDRFSNSGAISAPCARRNKNPERRRTQPVQLSKSTAIEAESPSNSVPNKVEEARNVSEDQTVGPSSSSTVAAKENEEKSADPILPINPKPAIAPKPSLKQAEAEKQSDSSSSSDLPAPPPSTDPVLPTTTSTSTTFPSAQPEPAAVPPGTEVPVSTRKKETGLLETDL